MFKALARLLFDWVFVLLFKMLTALLKLVDFVEDIFEVFAGTAKVTYNGQKDYLINVFFGQSSISVVFWGITAIAMTLCFAFTIVAVTRKTLDIGDSVKNSVGQILTNAGKAGLTFLILNFVCIASINLANVVLVQVDYLMKNANTILEDDQEYKTFNGEEYSAMTRIMNTISNYSLAPSPDNRFNINACYNAVRGDLYYLYYNGMFDGYYGEGHDNWQAALALIAGAADIENDLPLGEVNSSVTDALMTVMNELKYNPDFKPLQSVPRLPKQSMRMDNTIFLTASLEAPYSSVYRRNPSFTDALRRSYSDGTKSYTNLKQVRKDFDIWEVRYDIGYVTCIVFIIIMVKCVFTFIIRLFDLLLLYISAPFFVSTMPLDDGQKFQAWRSAFIVKLISGFGSVMAMRLYLMLVPVVMDGKLVFFENAGTNYLAQILFILAGAFAVMKATSLLSNIVAGTPGAAARGEELGAFMGSAVLGKGMNMAVGGLSAAGHLGKHAVSGVAHKISSHRSSKEGGEEDYDDDDEFESNNLAQIMASPRAAFTSSMMGGGMYGAGGGMYGAGGGMYGAGGGMYGAGGGMAGGGMSGGTGGAAGGSGGTAGGIPSIPAASGKGASASIPAASDKGASASIPAASDKGASASGSADSGKEAAATASADSGKGQAAAPVPGRPSVPWAGDPEMAVKAAATPVPRRGKGHTPESSMPRSPYDTIMDAAVPPDDEPPSIPAGSGKGASAPVSSASGKGEAPASADSDNGAAAVPERPSVPWAGDPEVAVKAAAMPAPRIKRFSRHGFSKRHATESSMPRSPYDTIMDAAVPPDDEPPSNHS